MSADNGIYILVTIDKDDFHKPILCYRVAYAAAIDNFDYSKLRGPEALNEYINKIWGDSPIFNDRQKALHYANNLAGRCGYLEYGIQFITY